MSDQLDNGREPHADSHALAQGQAGTAAPSTPRMSAETLQAAMKVLGRLTGQAHARGALDVHANRS